jgi:hypothetical protein
MSAIESLLQYIRQSERLVVVTLTMTLAGLALFAGERWEVFDFRGLPGWARPAAEGVWTVCAVHVAIRTVMAFWSWATAAARFIAGIPQRRRRAAYNRPIIERLRATHGVERHPVSAGHGLQAQSGTISCQAASNVAPVPRDAPRVPRSSGGPPNCFRLTFQAPSRRSIVSRYASVPCHSRSISIS